MKKQIVTIGNMHICPMVTGVIPHVGGPVIGPGCPGVLINGIPISIIGDLCVCVGPPDIITQGHPGVMVNGSPVTIQNTITAHGGTIPSGVPGVTINSAKSVKSVTMNIKRIVFPKIRTVDSVGALIKGKKKKLSEAKRNQKKLKKSALYGKTELPDIDLSL